MSPTPTPIFIPTSYGDVSASVLVPEEVRGEPIMVIPGGNNPRVRDQVTRNVALRLAAMGRPVLRMDHPGAGTSPVSTGKKDKPRVLEEVCTEFLDLCGSEKLTIIGTCGGAMAALAIAQDMERVATVLTIACPFRARGKDKRRVRAGVAAVDAIGGKLAKALAAGHDREPTTLLSKLEGVVGAMPSVVERTRLVFLYGEDDEFLEDYKWLTASGTVSEAVADKMECIVLPEANLYQYSSTDILERLEETIVRSLADPSQVQA
jgi:pimeloyl-ACP methyl ester carboxylesterase